MSEYESLSDEQREFEQSLKQLKPLAPRDDAADLIFRAGQDAGRLEARRQLRRWQLSTLTASVCTLFAIGVNWFPSNPESDRMGTIAEKTESPASRGVVGPEPREPQPSLVKNTDEPLIVEEHAISEPPAARSSTVFSRWWDGLTSVSVSDEHSYLDLRNLILKNGVDALPQTSSGYRNQQSQPLISSPQRARELLDAEFPSQI